MNTQENTSEIENTQITFDADSEFSEICNLFEKMGDKVILLLGDLHSDYERAHIRWICNKSDTRHLAATASKISKLSIIYAKICSLSNDIENYWRD